LTLVVLTKLGVISENYSQHGLQQQIRELDREISKTHQEIIENMRKVALAKKSSERWGIATKVASWIVSFLTIATGVTLIATGAGAAAGGLLIAGGVLSLTNHLLEITGGWNKLATTLGGDDSTKTRSMIMWMQLGVAIISMILAGAGVVFGGMNAIKEAMGTAGMLSSAGANASIGLLLIGQAIVNKEYYRHMAQQKEKEKHLLILKQQKEDLIAIAEEILDSMKNFWEDFFRVLEIYYSDTTQINRIIRGG
jgi:hypothetical protein